MEFKIYTSLPEDAKEIRKTVFINEQGFKNEFDNIDKTAYHILCFENGTPIGTARIYNDNESLTYHIGRIAVLKEYRNLHIGSKIISYAENEIKKLNGNKIVLSAQVKAKGFYEKCGFTSQGDIYLDEHCPHIYMYKLL